MLRATTTRYVIQSVEKKLMSEGGIILRHSDEQQLAQVVSIGRDVKDPVPLGAFLIINWHDAVAVKHENQQFYVIDYRAVHAVVEDYEYE